jgi:hypothetical protein
MRRERMRANNEKPRIARDEGRENVVIVLVHDRDGLICRRA